MTVKNYFAFFLEGADLTFNWSKPFKSLSLVPFRIGIAGLWLLILYATFGTLVIYCPHRIPASSFNKIF